MTTEQLIQYLRNSMLIAGAGEDTEYKAMSDEDILLYIQVALTRNYPEESLDTLPTECVYPLLLLSQKELLYSLAIKEAPLYNLGADGSTLTRSNRFEHYMALIKQVDSEYMQYLEDGGAGNNTLTSFDVLLPNRYFTRRNQEKGVIPALSLYVDSVTSSSIEVSWKTKNVSMFNCYRVWVSRDTIYDPYAEGESKISSTAKLLTTIMDAHQTCCRISDLSLVSGDKIHVCVSVTTMSGLTGFSESVAEYTALEVSGGGV